MARPRNQQAVDDVVRAAKRLFAEKGYCVTSYSDIARESGVARATVQDYFPKKDQFADEMLVSLRECSRAVVVREFPAADDPLVFHYILGQVFLQALLSCDSARRFSLDILAERKFMNKEIINNIEWSLRLVGVKGLAREQCDTKIQDLIVVMGGIYELIFYSLTQEESIDCGRHLRRGIEVLNDLLGGSSSELDEIFATYTIAPAVLNRLGLEAYTCSFNCEDILSAEN